MLCWKMMAKGYATCTASSFSNMGCIKSAPGALSVLGSCSFFWTSAAVIVMSAINSTSQSRLGMFVWSSVVKTELKNSLSSIAISFGSSIRLPVMSRNGSWCLLSCVPLCWWSGLVCFPLASVLVRVGSDSSPGQLPGILGPRVLPWVYPSQLSGGWSRLLLHNDCCPCTLHDRWVRFLTSVQMGVKLTEK